MTVFQILYSEFASAKSPSQIRQRCERSEPVAKQSDRQQSLANSQMKIIMFKEKLCYLIM